MTHSYRAVTTYEEVLQLQKDLNEASSWSFDTEGTSLDIFKNKIIGIGFSWERFQGVYLPIRQYKPIIGVTNYWGEKQKEVLEILQNVLSNDSQKAAHNSKYDVQVLFLDLGMAVANLAVDTMLLLSLVDSGRERYGLDAISNSYQDLAGYKQKVSGKDLTRLPFDELVEYNCSDCDLTFRIVEDNIDKLMSDDKMSSLFTELIMPLVNMITRMEISGIRVDTEAAKKLHKELFDELALISEEVKQVAGKKINVRSGDQLAELLFDKLKIPWTKKTKSGKPSTGKQALADLSKKTKHPVLKKIMTYRSLAASKTGFVDGFIRPANRKDNLEKDYLLDKNNYIHGNYKLISKTGRLRSGKDEDNADSGNSRNLQNTSRDPRFRRLFLPDVGHAFVGADYAQLELRVLAHVCGDEGLLRAFKEDYDPHCLVGSYMMGISYEEVLDGYKRKEQRYVDIRNLSKNIGFGWVYMAGDGRFAYLFPGRTENERKVAEKEAKDRYFSRFSKIGPWRNNSLEFARENGYVRTLSGRKIMTPDINSKIDKVKSHAEKQCVNALIQGPASDMTCLSAVMIDTWINENEKDARVVNLIHDAIYATASLDIAEEFFYKMKEIMELPKFGIKTKMKADIHIWDRWEGEEIKFKDLVTKEEPVEEFAGEVIDITDDDDEDDDENET